MTTYRRDLAYWKLGRGMTREERQCFLKQKLGEDAAVAEAERLRAKGEQSVRAYRCSGCGEWHVGHCTLRKS